MLDWVCSPFQTYDVKKRQTIGSNQIGEELIVDLFQQTVLTISDHISKWNNNEKNQCRSSPSEKNQFDIQRRLMLTLRLVSFEMLDHECSNLRK